MPAAPRYQRSGRIRKCWALKDYRHPLNQLQTSPTPPMSRKKSAPLVLRTVQHAISEYSLVPPPAQCSVLCMPRCLTTPHHLHNTNASRVLVQQYSDASAVVKLWVVGKRCHTSCTPCTMHGIVRVAHVPLCILNFAGGFPHTIRSTF